MKLTLNAYLQISKPFFNFFQKNLAEKNEKNVQKTIETIHVCTSKIINCFFHSLLIFRNSKYQMQIILWEA